MKRLFIGFLIAAALIGCGKKVLHVVTIHPPRVAPPKAYYGKYIIDCDLKAKRVPAFRENP